VFELETAAPESRSRAAINTALRLAPRLGVAAAFIFIGYTKFDNDPQGEWVQIFDRIGIGQWFRYLTGVLQVGGGLLMIFQRTLTIGAAMLAATMLGAAFVDIVLMGSPMFILPMLLLFIVATVWATSQ
jgi:putative oxidoreductase